MAYFSVGKDCAGLRVRGARENGELFSEEVALLDLELLLSIERILEREVRLELIVRI